MSTIVSRSTQILITALTCTFVVHAAPAAILPRFTLEDQYERKWQHSDFRSPLVVYVISDRAGYSYSANWTTPLVREYGQRIRFVPIADVRGVPGFLKGYIRSRFKKEFSYPVLLDWDGTITNGIHFTAGYTNLAIVDANRSIRYTAVGTGTAPQIEAFRTRLNKLINETNK